MKKLFGILVGGAVALSLTACDDDEANVWKDGTGVAYSLGTDTISKATVNVANDEFTVDFDTYYTLSNTSYSNIYLATAAGYADIFSNVDGTITTEYTYVGLDTTADSEVDTYVFTYIEVAGVLYTFNETTFAASTEVDGAKFLDAYEATGDVTLLDYENGITSGTGTEANAIAYIEAYEAGNVKVLSDENGTASAFAAGQIGHLNKSDADSTYWVVEDGLGWKGNIEQITSAFETDSSLFEVDFTDTDVELGSATVYSKYSYAELITQAYDKLEKA